MGNVTLKVSGMSCGQCVSKVKAALQHLNGVEKATVNIKKGMAQVKYDASVQTLDALTEALREVGYEAELAK